MDVIFSRLHGNANFTSGRAAKIMSPRNMLSSCHLKFHTNQELSFRIMSICCFDASSSLSCYNLRPIFFPAIMCCSLQIERCVPPFRRCSYDMRLDYTRARPLLPEKEIDRLSLSLSFQFPFPFPFVSVPFIRASCPRQHLRNTKKSPRCTRR